MSFLFIAEKPKRKVLVYRQSLTLPPGGKKDFAENKKRNTLMNFQMDKKWEKVGNLRRAFQNAWILSLRKNIETYF